MVNGITAHTLAQALDIMALGEYIPYAGGTDLMTKEKPERKFLYLHDIPELKTISESGGYIKLGAGLTFSQLLRLPETPPLLRQAISRIGSPAIRNLGTIGGNIANGSPKADSALIFFVTESLLALKSRDGERQIPIRDFYRGRKKLDLLPGELITEIMMPKEAYEFYYNKIGARRALAISRVSFAGIIRVGNAGVIEKFATAFGAISDVIIRRTDIDSMLEGLNLSEAAASKENYLNAYKQAIIPLEGRISAQYRKEVCLNLLTDFLETKVFIQ